jgi:hypothetical protein
MPEDGPADTLIRLDLVRWDAANFHSINTGHQLNDVVAFSIAHKARLFPFFMHPESDGRIGKGPQLTLRYTK